MPLRCVVRSLAQKCRVAQRRSEASIKGVDQKRRSAALSRSCSEVLLRSVAQSVDQPSLSEVLLRSVVQRRCSKVSLRDIKYRRVAQKFRIEASIGSVARKRVKQKCRSEVLLSVDQKCCSEALLRSEVSRRSVAQNCCSEVSIRSDAQKCRSEASLRGVAQMRVCVWVCV